MEGIRILVGSPVRQRPAVLREFLSSLTELHTSGLTVHYFFLDDNDTEEASEQLAQFAQENERVVVEQANGSTAPYIRDEQTHFWKDELVWKVATMKDHIIERALQEGYDYLFFIDSDLVLHPRTLQQLVASGKEIISNIFWTKWSQNASELPQVWLYDQYKLYESGRDESLSDEEVNRRIQAFLRRLRIPGIYEVGGLGACTLISRKALEGGVRFARIYNVSFWGEDRHFCIRAAALGFRLHVDTHYPAYHIYRESELPGVQAYKAQYARKPRGDREMTVSLCMIVKNEEDVLERCLSSVADVVDEIIIVDTGSSDRTKEIAARFTERIYDFEWIDDFSAARNYAFSKATMTYILWLDADDCFTDTNRELLIKTIQSLDHTVDSVTMPYVLSVDANGNVTHSLRRNRLVRRDKGFRWIGPVHEYLAVSGKIIHSEAAVTHLKEKAYTDRNLQIYRKREHAGEIFAPRDLYYYANELKDHSLFEEAIDYYDKFLSTGQGWVEDMIQACLKQAFCYGRLCETDKALGALFRSMSFDKPRAEALCRIGAIFLETNRFPQAIYWYELATTLTKPADSLAMLENDAWTWLPHLQLCLCYDRVGDYVKARAHNDIALTYHPTHPSILFNKQYFDRKFASEPASGTAGESS